jgi:hypothetical protein
MFTKGQDTTAHVKAALTKAGYYPEFTSAIFESDGEVNEVHFVVYVNDDGVFDSGRVYVNRFTGKGEY